MAHSASCSSSQQENSSPPGGKTLEDVEKEKDKEIIQKLIETEVEKKTESLKYQNNKEKITGETPDEDVGKMPHSATNNKLQEKDKEVIQKLIEIEVEKKTESLKYQNNLLWVVVIVVLALQVSPLFMSSLTSRLSNMKGTATLSDGFRFSNIMTEEIAKMEPKFPFVDKVSWNMLKNIIGRHIDQVQSGNGASPLSFLLVGNEVNTLHCFSKMLAETFTDQFASIDSNDHVGLESKVSLDEALINSLEQNKVLIVKNINSLDLRTAQLFMTYCDVYNTKATYPDSIIILTSVIPFRNSDDRKAIEIYSAERFKQAHWANQDPDTAAALWSRIGDGIVVVKSSNKNQCF